MVERVLARRRLLINQRPLPGLHGIPDLLIDDAQFRHLLTISETSDPFDRALGLETVSTLKLNSVEIEGFWRAVTVRSPEGRP